MPTFTDTTAPGGTPTATDGTWIVALRERNDTVGIEARDAATDAIKGWARIIHDQGKWKLSEFTPAHQDIPPTVHAEARRIFKTVV